jgi:hypothetical protein
VEKYTLFQPLMNIINQHQENNAKTNSRLFPYEVLMNKHIVVLLMGFGLFILAFTFFKATNIFTKLYNYIIVLLTITMSGMIIFRISNLVASDDGHKFTLHERVPLFGSDYTYVTKY